MTDHGARDGLSRLLGMALAGLLGLLGVGGCQQDQGPAPPPAHDTIGSDLLVSDEGMNPGIRDNPELEIGAQLITTEEERDAFLASEPLGPDMTAVTDVDLGSSVIVVGAYWSCAEVGTVVTDGTSVWFEVQTMDDRDCAEAPFTAHLIEVPREDFPGEVELSEPPTL